MIDVFTLTGFVVLVMLLLLLFLFVAIKILEVVGRIMRQSKSIHFGAISIWHGRHCKDRARRVIIDYIKHVKVDDPYWDYDMKQAIKQCAKAIDEAESEELKPTAGE